MSWRHHWKSFKWGGGGSWEMRRGNQMGLPLQPLFWGLGHSWGIRGRGQSNWDPLSTCSPQPPAPSFLSFGLLTCVKSSWPSVLQFWGQCVKSYLTQVRSVPTHIMVRGGQCLVLTWSTAVKSGCPSPPKKDCVKFTEFKEPESTRSRRLRGQRET